MSNKRIWMATGAIAATFAALTGLSACSEAPQKTDPVAVATDAPTKNQQGICPSAQLRAEVGDPTMAAGSSYFNVTLTNLGAPCTMEGYPGVSLLDGQGNQVGAAADRDGTEFQPVTLPAGGSAGFTMRITNARAYEENACQPTTSVTDLKIFPPGETNAITIPFGTVTCANDTTGVLQVSPVTSYSK